MSGAPGGRLDKPALIASDVHLGAVPAATERAFLDFLAYATEEASALLINGDLFDVGPMDPGWEAPTHHDVLRSLREAVRKGLPIAFVGGNRDPVEWSGPTLAAAGLQVLPDPSPMPLAGRRALVAHGDGARHGAARPYRKPEAWMSHPALITAVRTLRLAGWLHGTLDRFSPTHARVAAAVRGESTGPKRRAPAIEAWARAMLAADPELSLVVAGHSHLPALVEIAPGHYYVNAGDWTSHHTYALVPPGGEPPEVRYWPSRARVDWTTLHDAEVPASAFVHAQHQTPGPAVPVRGRA